MTNRSVKQVKRKVSDARARSYLGERVVMTFDTGLVQYGTVKSVKKGLVIVETKVGTTKVLPLDRVERMAVLQLEDSRGNTRGLNHAQA